MPGRRDARARWMALVLGAVVVAHVGCSPSVRMMPAPLAFREAGPDPFAAVSSERRSTSVEVFYATDREPTSPDRSSASYGSGRSGSVRLGRARVRFGPTGWGWDDLNARTAAGERPSITVTRVEETDVLETGVLEAGGVGAGGVGSGASMSAEGLPRASGAVFASHVNAQLARSRGRDVYVYVPGINLTFELGVRRMAEFGHYLGRDGVFMTYAWPAHDHPFAYGTDRRSARRSVEGFREFLRFLATETDAERIHLITSSAGAPVVSETLAALRDERPGASADAVRSDTKIGEVVYAASDQGVDDFREMLDSGAAEMAEHITIYSSSVDMGLMLTKVFGSGDRTIGRLPAHMRDDDAAHFARWADRVTVVDVTNAMGPAGRGDFWAHRYWYLNPWVSSDLLGVLRHRIDPAARALVPSGDGPMWRFPDDYAARLRAQLEACDLRPASGEATDTLSRSE
ncbi:MAG: alpha/beta hydrolase [Phycisphaerales bacterium JB041]